MTQMPCRCTLRRTSEGLAGLYFSTSGTVLSRNGAEDAMGSQEGKRKTENGKRQTTPTQPGRRETGDGKRPSGRTQVVGVAAGVLRIDYRAWARGARRRPARGEGKREKGKGKRPRGRKTPPPSPPEGDGKRETPEGKQPHPPGRREGPTARPDPSSLGDSLLRMTGGKRVPRASGGGFPGAIGERGSRSSEKGAFKRACRARHLP